MFTANTSSDLANGINAVAQCFQSIRSTNNGTGTGNSGNSNHDDTISQPPRQGNATIGGISMSGTTDVGSNGVLLSHQNAPSVCVVSSSMDFFGAPESSYYSPPPTTTTTVNNSTSFVNPASVPTTHIVNNEGQVHTTAPTVSNKKKSIDIDTSASTSHIKKIKHNSKIKDVVPRDRSLERAAVAAVLASLDSANKKTDVKPTTSNEVDTTTTTMKSDTTTRGISPSRLPKKKLQDVSRAVLGTSSLGGIHTPDKSKVYKPDMNPQFRGTTTSSSSYIPESTPNVNISNTVPITGNFSHVVVKKEAIPVVQAPPIVDGNIKQQNEQVNISNNNITKDVEPYVPSFRSKHDPNWKPAIIPSPGQYDVLLGRGKSNKNHPGNKRFQDFIQANRDRYFNALTNTAKRGITLEILQVIRQKGKFLRRGTQGWVEVPTAEIQQKVAHALQYRRRCVIKERQTSPERSPNDEAVSSMNHTIPIAFNSNVSNIDPRLLSLAISSSMGASHPRLTSNPMADQNKRPDEYYMNRLGENRRKHCDSDDEDNDDDDMDDDDDDDHDHNNNQYDNQRIDQVHQQQYASAMISEFLRNNQSVVTGGVPTMNNNNNNTTQQISTPTITNSNYPLNAALNHVVGSTSYPQQINPYQRPPPNSDNLDASGLHSLAEVISRMCHPDGVVDTNNNNSNNAMNRVGY